MSLDVEFEIIFSMYSKDYKEQQSDEEIDSTMKLYFNRIKYFEDKTGLLNKINQARLNSFLGQYYTFISDIPEKVIFYYGNTINILNNSSYNEINLALIYGGLGYAYQKLSKDEEALDSFQKAAFLSINTRNIRGRCLYSFRPVNKFFLQDLINNDISVTSPMEFNDPFDCLFFSLLEREKIKYNNENIHLFKAYNYLKVRCFVSNYDINSEVKREGLIEEYKNFLMWSHYADSHRGVCVKYNFHSNFFHADKNEMICTTMYDVDYSNSHLHSDSGIIKVQQAFATKQQCWEYENEVRILHYDPNCDSTFKELPLGENGNVEAVYFGLKCPQKDIDTIRGILTEDVAYYQMKEDDEDIFKLVEAPLNQKAEALLAAAAVAVTENVSVE